MYRRDGAEFLGRLETFSTGTGWCTSSCTFALEDLTKLVEAQGVLEKRDNELQAATIELRNLTNHVMNIREEERRRIASDIHDDLGQRLTAMNLGLHWLSTKTDDQPDFVHSRILELMKMNSDTLSAVQDLARRLRPKLLDKLGLKDALVMLVADIGKRGGPTSKVVYEVARATLDPIVSITIYRLAQECLSNILKHAKANHMTLTLREEDDQLIFTAVDDGGGVGRKEQDGNTSLGLIGMRERALHLGGSFSISNGEGSGTKVEIVIPLSPKDTYDNA